MSLVSTISFLFSPSLTVDDVFSNPFNPRLDDSKTFTNGTDDGKADLTYIQKRAAAAAGADVMDLSGSLLQPDQSPAVFVEIVGIAIRNFSAGTIKLGGGSNAFATWFDTAAASTTKLVVKPLGCFLLYAPNDGYAVTAGTGDLFQVTTADTGPLVYAVGILGRSA